MPGLEIRRAAGRASTSTEWLHSAHSFAFGAHYDPANLSFGSLLVNNVDLVQPGPGYARHAHAGVEILTWVLDGALEHSDATGQRRVEPGTLQYLAAGSGIEHAERSASATEPVRVLQMWLATDDSSASRYQLADLSRLLLPAELALVASGSRPAPIALRQPAAELAIGRLPAGTVTPLPAAPLGHLFLASGAVELAGELLAAEDAARITGGEQVELTVAEDAELLVWTMAAPGVAART